MAFLKLGVTSFGGPIAHIGYYRDELVVRRKWLDETTFADLVALCQFLPGPASSQVGFSLGILRGNGLLGGLAAWFAFTMPSAIIMFAFALGAAAFDGPVAAGFLHGLKLVAVAVVAQAVWGMTRSLTPDRPRAGIALAAIAIVVLFAGSLAQIAAIALGACAGLWLCRGDVAPVSGQLNFPVTRLAGSVALILFAVLLLLSPVVTVATGSHALAVFDAFYRSGALVFGGGLHWYTIAMGTFLLTVGHWALVQAAKFDPQLSRVYVRHVNHQDYYPARASVTAPPPRIRPSVPIPKEIRA